MKTLANRPAGRGLDELRCTDLEVYWLRRVRQAHRSYLDAAKRQMRLKTELEHSSFVDGDCAFLVAKAKRTEEWTRYEFCRRLQLCLGLVVGREPPPPDEEAPLGL